jgi:hypothetical protein
MIKKITNIRFSDSEKLKNNKKVELSSRRNRLLLETDWTQLPDIKLSSNCRAAWTFWRKKLRMLSMNTHSFSEYKEELDKFEIERHEIPIEYIYEEDAEKVKSRLLAKVSNEYNKRTTLQYMPNLEIKFEETLTLITDYFTSHNITLPDHSLSALIEYFEGSSDIDLDMKNYPFINMVSKTYNMGARSTILNILRQRRDFYETALHEEHMMLHFRTRIIGAPLDDPKTVQDIEDEIVTYYGY